MNRKIPFHDLASLLAANCNISPEEAEDFIKNFFDQIAGSLSDGDTVKIKGIGTFSLTNEKDTPVSFVPDSEIADTVNAPFALFEPEALSDTLSDETLADIEAPVDITGPTIEEPATPEPVDDSEVQHATTVAGGEIIASDEVVEAPMAENPESVEPAVVAEPVIPVESDKPETTAEESDKPDETEKSAEEEPVRIVEEPAAEATSSVVSVAVETPVTTTTAPSKAPTVAPAPVAPAVKVSAPAFPEEEPEEYLPDNQYQKSGPGFGWGFLTGLIVGLALGACAVYFAIDYIIPTPVQEEVVEDAASDEEVAQVLAEAEAVLRGDTAVSAITSDTPTATPESNAEPKSESKASSPVPAQPAAEPVKDTVKAGYLLHDMAKKHYGNKCFWVYIYEENKAKISNPNRVSPGLVLVIPPAEKYGINASNSASVKAANEKAGKILAKYPR